MFFVFEGCVTTKNTFIANVERDTDPGNTSIQNRRAVVNLLRSDLSSDNQEMRQVAGQPETDPVWSDIYSLQGVDSEEKTTFISDIRNLLHITLILCLY